MANEISLSLTLTYNNPAAHVASNTISAVDAISILSTPAYERNVQVVTTSKSPLSLVLITTLGVCVLHNCDATNSISVFLNSSDTGSLLLNPGEWQVVRFDPSDVPQVKTSAGTALLEYFALSS